MASMTPLTPAEERIVAYVAQGYENLQIATRLGRSLDTIKHHVGAAMQKTNSYNRVQLALWYWREHGTVEGRTMYGGCG